MDKQVLEERCSDLTFDDDVTEFLCVQCGEIAITHFTSDCHHVFCDFCKRIHGDDVNYKCPKCRSTNITMGPSDPTFEEKLLSLIAHCPNTTNGCRVTLTLEEMPAHMKKCKHVVIPQSTYEPDKDLEMRQMLEQVKTLTSTVTSLTSTVEELKRDHGGDDSADISTREAFDQMHFYVSVPQQSKKNEQQKKLDDMQNEIKMLKAMLEIQQPIMNAAESSATYPLQLASGSAVITSTTTQFTLKDQTLKVLPNKEYNVLLLGQTGAGKSTFINAFANYLTYASLEEALSANLVTVLQCQQNVSDDEYKQHSCKVYKFPLQDTVLQMIDTPGMDDSRGIDQDCRNLEEILSFITKYEELHAICILLKQNESKLTKMVQFYITQLLRQLHENAFKNIVFIFTNSRTTSYVLGDAIAPLKEMLSRIKATPPYTDIPFYKGNTFCLDSEAFKFLEAVKNDILFTDAEYDYFRKSWKKSVEECRRLIDHVIEGPDSYVLVPHSMEDPMSVSELCMMIFDMSKPLADNAKHLQDNIHILKRRRQEIDNCTDDLYRLKMHLYVPTLTLKVKELVYPQTICTDHKCRQIYKVGDLDKFHYPMKCHDPCNLQYAPGDFIGPHLLRNCDTMNKWNGLCKHCSCHFSKHDHIYYESYVVERKEVDQTIQSQLMTKEGASCAVMNSIQTLTEKVKEYTDAYETLINIAAKLAVFLRHNAKGISKDHFEEYLKEQIEDEKSLNEQGANNTQLVERLKALLQQYNHEKDIVEEAIEGPVPINRLTLEEIKDMITQLSKMNICGETITEMVEAHRKTKQKEIAQRDIPVLYQLVSTVKNAFFSKTN